MKMAPLIAAGAWLMSLALTSPSYWWLGWVTLLPLFLAIRFLPSLPAAACGACWGLSLYLFAAGERASGVSASAWLMLTVIPGAFAGIAAEVTQRKGFHPLLLGLGWVGVELAMQPLAMHNGLLASTQGDSLLVQSVGHLGGYVLVAFILAVINAVLLGILVEHGAVATRTLYARLELPPEAIFQAVDSVPGVARMLRRLRPRAPPAV